MPACYFVWGKINLWVNYELNQIIFLKGKIMTLSIASSQPSTASMQGIGAIQNSVQTTAKVEASESQIARTQMNKTENTIVNLANNESIYDEPTELGATAGSVYDEPTELGATAGSVYDEPTELGATAGSVYDEPTELSARPQAGSVYDEPTELSAHPQAGSIYDEPTELSAHPQAGSVYDEPTELSAHPQAGLGVGSVYDDPAEILGAKSDSRRADSVYTYPHEISIFEVEKRAKAEPAVAPAGESFKLLPPAPPPTKSLTSVRELKGEIRILTDHYRDNDVTGIRRHFHKTPLDQLTNAMRDYFNAQQKMQVNNKGDVNRAENVTKLYQKLDVVQAKLTQYQDFMAKQTGGDARVSEFLDNIHEEIDNERLALARVVNNQNIAQKSVNSNEPNQETKNASFYTAVQLKVHGYDYNNAIEVAIDNKTDKWRVFNSGNVNTVFEITQKDGENVIFKREQAKMGHAIAVDELLSTPDTHPHFGGRNIATSNIDKALGTDVIANTRFMEAQFMDASGDVRQELGIGMDRVYGRGWTSIERSELKVIIKNPEMIKDLLNLQVVDALTMQMDRHNKNFLIEQASDGSYLGLKGIDNDNGFDSNNKPMDITKLHANQHYESGLYGSHNVGLPPLMDRDLAVKLSNPRELRELVGNACNGLISPENVVAAKLRANTIAAHAQQLLNEGRTVSNWNSGYADNGEKISNILKNPANGTSYISRMLGDAPWLKLA